jgi:recombinational DNA repair ATPase RecF
MLKSISFHPFPETGQLDLTLRDLATVNILVGANGAGKSRVLRAVKLASGEKSHEKSNFVTTAPPNILVGARVMLQTASTLLDIKGQEKYLHQALRIYP